MINYDILILLEFFAAIISVVVGILSIRRRPAEGAVSLFILMISIAVWNLSQAMVYLDFSLPVKLFWANTRYFGIEAIGIGFLGLAYDYKMKREFLNKRKFAFLCILPTIFLILLWTNPYHYLFYKAVRLEGKLLILENGLFFWLNVFFVYTLIVIGVTLFADSYIKSSSIYKSQAGMLLVSTLFPLVSNILFNFNLLPIKDIDITPIIFFITGFSCFIAMFQFRLFDIVPIARDKLFLNIEDIVIVIDSKYRILDMNNAAKEFIFDNSFLNQEYIGIDIFSFINKWEGLSNVVKIKEIIKATVHIERESKNKSYLLTKSDVVYNKNKQAAEIIVLRDITELEEALYKARQASISKGYFVANMSHELRTPLNAVIGIADILYSNPMEKEEQREYIGVLKNSAESLLRIINDILDFSKIEAGKMEIEKIPTDIREVVEDCVKALSIYAKGKDLKIVCSIDDSIPRFIIADSVRIRQIIFNIVGNAIKFTESGSVEINVVYSEDNLYNPFLQISIKDTGIGIPEHKLLMLFESFNQLDVSTSRRYGGTGLGLSIVKNLLDLMGGSIEVKSEVGKGSIFTFTIPYEICDDGDFLTAVTQDKKNVDSQISLSILIVDDNSVNRMLLGKMLKNMHCTVDYAEDGLIAIEKWKNNFYDVIFMDIQMPNMDGLSATEEIRRLEVESGEHIIIVALTAGAFKEDMQNCFNSGMDYYLSKPIKSDKLSKQLDIIKSRL